MSEKLTAKVLITVMTYPHPSRGYQELVCTAGVTESGEWIRLYPVDYRYREQHQQFKKYQWIEVVLGPNGAGKDNRKESRRPDLDSIKLLGEPLNTKNKWQDRRAIIDRLPPFHSQRTRQPARTRQNLFRDRPPFSRARFGNSPGKYRVEARVAIAIHSAHSLRPVPEAVTKDSIHVPLRV